MGDQRAALALYTGDWITADDAVACGLALRAVEPDELMRETMDLARRIAKHAGRARSSRPSGSCSPAASTRSAPPARREDARVRPHGRRGPPTSRRSPRSSRSASPTSARSERGTLACCAMTIAATRSGKIEGVEHDGVLVFRGHPVRGAARRRAAAGCRRARGRVGRRARRDAVLRAVGAGRPFAMDAHARRRRSRTSAKTASTSTCGRRRATTRAAGDGLDPRRRVHLRLGRHAVVRRHAASRRTATSSSSRSTTGSGPFGFLHLADLFGDDVRGLRQRRHPRPGRRARMGARLHRGVRRRPRQRHDLRRVGRRAAASARCSACPPRAACSTQAIAAERRGVVGARHARRATDGRASSSSSASACTPATSTRCARVPTEADPRPPRCRADGRRRRVAARLPCQPVVDGTVVARDRRSTRSRPATRPACTCSPARTSTR